MRKYFPESARKFKYLCNYIKKSSWEKTANFIFCIFFNFFHTSFIVRIHTGGAWRFFCWLLALRFNLLSYTQVIFFLLVSGFFYQSKKGGKTRHRKRRNRRENSLKRHLRLIARELLNHKKTSQPWIRLLAMDSGCQQPQN